jgi:hypothetical protein
VARIVIEAIVLCLILAALFSFSRRWSGQRGVQHRSPAIAAEAPAEALWRARHVGNENNQTEVHVVLQVPGGTDVWDRRICAVIENQDPDYDKRLYNAMEDARSRAALLNSMRDT